MNIFYANNYHAYIMINTMPPHNPWHQTPILRANLRRRTVNDNCFSEAPIWSSPFNPLAIGHGSPNRPPLVTEVWFLFNIWLVFQFLYLFVKSVLLPRNSMPLQIQNFFRLLLVKSICLRWRIITECSLLGWMDSSYKDQVYLSAKKINSR